MSSRNEVELFYLATIYAKSCHYKELIEAAKKFAVDLLPV